jgi:uncharacterized membrane protein HdeD (DUF308 family)
MDNRIEKHWWESKAVWGGVVALIAGILGVFGVAVSTAEQGLLVESLTGIAAAVGGLLAIYGRIKASKSIGK